jgi:hypothetical protein
MGNTTTGGRASYSSPEQIEQVRFLGQRVLD